MTPVLEIDGLGVRIDGGAILDEVSLTVAPGSVHGLVGESGAGKSMIGRAVLGILPGAAAITAGRISFAGADITHLPDRARRRLAGRGMALIPQDPMTSLNPAQRVGNQIAAVFRHGTGAGRREARARAIGLMDEVHIRHPERVFRLYPHELSGGMRQRILIAAAFACRPRLIIADEPTSSLDVTVQRQILRLIRDLQEQAGTAILLITHDLGVVAKTCASMTILQNGRVIEDGPVAGIFAAPRQPYTRALFRATPRYDRPAERIEPVPEALTVGPPAARRTAGDGDRDRA